MKSYEFAQKLKQVEEFVALPAELREWLECQDFILAMKCVTMGYPDCSMKSLRHIAMCFEGSHILTHYTSAKIAAFLATFDTADVFDDLDTAKKWAESMQTRLASALSMLEQSSLQDKREVLRYLQIISTPVAAVFLGVTERALNSMKHNHRCILGAEYAGGYCYSLEELTLIAENLRWTCDWDYTKRPEMVSIDSAILDYAILVDEKTAVAITQEVPALLQKLVSTTEHLRRPYRLAELEQIRLVKVRAQQV